MEVEAGLAVPPLDEVPAWSLCIHAARMIVIIRSVGDRKGPVMP
jgi:hypothetical protein